MTARTWARAGAALSALVLCGTGWAAFAPTAAAVDGVQSGYWSSLPATPQVPAGGIEVAATTNGPQAVSAVRFTLGAGESAPVLTLKVAQAAPPQAQIVIEACAVAARSKSWQPPATAPGAMADAPTADCTNGLVAGAVAADVSTVQFDLSTLPTDGQVVDVVLQPGVVALPTGGTVPGAPGTGYPTFDVAFVPVTAAQIATSTSVVSTGGGSSYGGASGTAPSYPMPAAPVAGGVALPPSATGDTGGAAPVVAPSAQPSNAALSSPYLVTKKRNLRLLFAVAMLSSDLLFVLLWAQRRLPGPDERPLISIYDPPPAVS